MFVTSSLRHVDMMQYQTFCVADKHVDRTLNKFTDITRELLDQSYSKWFMVLSSPIDELNL